MSRPDPYDTHCDDPRPAGWGEERMSEEAFLDHMHELREGKAMTERELVDKLEAMASDVEERLPATASMLLTLSGALVIGEDLVMSLAKHTKPWLITYHNECKKRREQRGN